MKTFVNMQRRVEPTIFELELLKLEVRAFPGLKVEPDSSLNNYFKFTITVKKLDKEGNYFIKSTKIVHFNEFKKIEKKLLPI